MTKKEKERKERQWKVYALEEAVGCVSNEGYYDYICKTIVKDFVDYYDEKLKGNVSSISIADIKKVADTAADVFSCDFEEREGKKIYDKLYKFTFKMMLIKYKDIIINDKINFQNFEDIDIWYMSDDVFQFIESLGEKEEEKGKSR